MRDFIFDQYGYYYDDAESSEFTYGGFSFRLVSTTMSEQELIELEDFISTNYKRLSFNNSCHLVKNRNGIYGVESEFGNVCLVTSKSQKFSLVELLELEYMGREFKPKSELTVQSLITLWEEKLNFVEEKCVPYLKIDDFTYPMVLKETIYAIGLCSNAIQYLTDIKSDYGDRIERVTFTHKRLYDFSSFDLLNPFNIVYDSPVRDWAFLYKEEKLSIEDIVYLIEYFNLEQNEISLLMARTLFPTATFDILEDNYSLKKDIKLPIVKKAKETKRDVKLISTLHKMLIERYKIRPIEWLKSL